MSVFNKHKVKYLVVGAYAVGYHTQPRATKNLDVLIQPAPKNGEAVYRALVEFGAAKIQNLTPADFSEKGPFARAWRTSSLKGALASCNRQRPGPNGRSVVLRDGGSFMASPHKSSYVAQA